MSYILTDVNGRTNNISNEIIFKNILERIFMGIFITMFTHEMGKDNYYNVFKVNSNISKYGIESPMQKEKTDFNNMSEWLNEWQNTRFSWNGVWDNFAAVIDDYVNTGKVLNFLNKVTTIDEMIPLIKREFRYPEYVEWTAMEEVESDKSVTIQILETHRYNVFRIGDPVAKIRYTSSYPQRARMQINNLEGDVTIGGILRTNNIEPTEKDGKVNISSADIGSLYVNGQEIKPSPDTIDTNMGHTWRLQYLYPNNTIGSDSTIEERKIILANEKNENEEIDVPKVFIDYNNCGKIAFVTVRPFTIQRKPLIDTYVSTKYNKGIFYLPIPHFNPYGLPTEVRKNAPRGVLYQKSTKFTGAEKQKDLIADATPAKSNLYQLATSRWQWIKCEVQTYASGNDKDKISKTKYVVWQEGTVTFVIEELKGQHVNLQWNENLSSKVYSPTEGYKLYREYIYVDGFTFVAPLRNEGEKSDFYQNTVG